MVNVTSTLKEVLRYFKYFFKALAYGLCIGAVGGLIGTAFCYAIGWATEFREAHRYIVWLLPLGGALIIFLYNINGLRPADTNGILTAVRSSDPIHASTGPLIFIGTVITHFFGGSAGREGAALQLGGVLGWHTARLFRQGEKDSHLFVMTGMSAVFAALFGTPVTAAVFALEVISVGILQFSALVPCLCSALTAATIAKMLGVPSESFFLPAVDFSLANIGGTVLIAAAAALMSIVYCICMHKGHKIAAKLLPNPYIRVMAAGLAVALISWLLGTGDYNGAGMAVIHRALEGEARTEAFAIKLVLTVITMSCGFKGGEIVPAMFIGATLGCVLGALVGLPAGLGAAMGLIAMFCGSLNCPLSGILLGLELFGGELLPFYAIAAAIGYMLSVDYGLFSQQKLMYSKLRPEFIDSYAR